MKKRLNKHLPLLLALLLLVSLFGGMNTFAAEDDGAIQLAFTSDVHYSTNYAQNNLEVWLGKIEENIGYIDNMSFCGDMGSAYAANAEDYWAYTQAVIDYMDSQIAAGKVGGTVYTFGNHEWYPYAGGDYTNNTENPAALRLKRMGEAVKTDKYIIYCMGAGSIAAAFGQGYDLEDIAATDAYLADAPKDIPIFVLTHFPIHYFDGRTTENCAALVEVLNKYPNVLLLWGHNHTVFDTYYDIFYKPGSALTVDAAGTKQGINFTYCTAGCMSDVEYSGAEGGSAFVQGKGLVVTIDDGKIDLAYYNMQGEAVPYRSSDGPFSVFFRDGLDGTFFDQQEIAAGAAAKEPAFPVHSGFEFTGWSESFDKVTDNMIIKANFEEIKLPVAAETPGKTGFVYITLEDQDAIAVGKSGAALHYYPIPYVEGMTIADAVIKLHELEYVDGVNGVVAADSGYGFANFSKLWGRIPAHGSLAFDAKGYLDAGSAAKDGGSYYVLAYDSLWKSTSFMTPGQTKAPVGKDLTLRALTLSMNSNYTYSTKGFTADVLVGTGLDSLQDSGIDVDATGYFHISFDKPGTYYVYAKCNSGAAGDALCVVQVYQPVVQPSTQDVTVDGAAVVTDVYNIDGSNYFKLRDIACALNGTAAQFSVDYDKATRSIVVESGKAYAAVGGEMTVGADNSASALASNQSLTINGKAVDLAAFNIGGSNYFMLRELADKLGFFVDYVAETRTAQVMTTDPKADAEPAGTVFCYAVMDDGVCQDQAGTPIAHYPVAYYEGESLADVVTRLHMNALGDKDGWAGEESSLTKLWGVASGSTNGSLWLGAEGVGKTAANLSDPAEDGMILYMNNMSAAVAYMRVGVFNTVYAEIGVGEELHLTFSRDSSGTMKANTGAKLLLNGVELEDVGAGGNVLKFDKAGTYLVTGTALNSWCAGVCVVVVK